MSDFDINDIDIEAFGGVSNNSVGIKTDSSIPQAQSWQLSREFVPSNPNVMMTSIVTKLRNIDSTKCATAFQFTEEGESVPLDEPTSIQQDNPLSLVQESWGDLGLSRQVLKAVEQVLRFPNPTMVQREVIPLGIKGSDVLATAATGSGKSAAFLLPIIERILMSPNVAKRRLDPGKSRVTGGRAMTRALVLLPTRELAVQCWSMFKALTKFIPITSALVVGGFDSNDQRCDLGRSPDVLLATPGRLLDHVLNSQGVHLDCVDMVVLDEADRLLELGFKDSIMEILKAIPKKSFTMKGQNQKAPKGQCQTLLFSATTNPSVKELASFVLREPLIIRVSEENRVVSSLTQEFVKVPTEELREAAFFSLLESSVHTTDHATRVRGRVIVFFKEKREAHRASIVAQIFGLRVVELHGNMNQAERSAAMADFQAGSSRYLFATDLAGRGLDLPNVELVVNYNLPPASDAEIRYIHRVGRTARMGRSGRAITLYTPEEYPVVKRIVKKAVDKANRAGVFERKLPGDLVMTWGQRIKATGKVFKQIETEESVEKSIYESSRKLSKAENAHAHQKDIMRRPKKVWLQSESMHPKPTARKVNRMEYKSKKQRIV